MAQRPNSRRFTQSDCDLGDLLPRRRVPLRDVPVLGGMVPLSLASMFATHFVLQKVAGRLVAIIGTAAVIIASLRWTAPLMRPSRHRV